MFFCYALSAPSADTRQEAGTDVAAWSEEAGYTRWYLYDVNSKQVLEEASEIIGLIRSTPRTPLHRALPDKTLSQIRVEVENYIKNTYFQKVQAPVGVKAKLKAWMEIS